MNQNSNGRQRRRNAALGMQAFGGLAMSAGALGLLVFVVVKCTGSDDAITPQDLDRIEANQIAKEKAGRHCLSGWDGRHVRLVEKFKTTLRDPSSFEHDKTIIAPVDDNGKHELMMRYRAKNGFGGMALGHVKAEVDNQTCGFKISDSS